MQRPGRVFFSICDQVQIKFFREMENEERKMAGEVSYDNAI